MKKMISILLIAIMFMGLISPITVSAAYDKAFVTISGYSIEEDAVVPGQEFTLKVTFKNTSRNKNIGNTMITMQADAEQIVPVYKNSNQIYIDGLDAGQEKNIEIKLKAAKQIKGDVVPVVFQMIYADEMKVDNLNTTTLSLPISTSGTLNIQSFSVADQAKIGTKARISATYENTGSDEISNITLHVTGSGLGADKEFKFDNLGGGEKNYAEAYIDFNSMGTQAISMSFTYDDAEGVTHETEIETFNVQVSLASNVNGTDITTGVISGSPASLVLYVVLGGAILVLIIIIIVLYRKSKH